MVRISAYTWHYLLLCLAAALSGATVTCNKYTTQVIAIKAAELDMVLLCRAAAAAAAAGGCHIGSNTLQQAM